MTKGVKLAYSKVLWPTARYTTVGGRAGSHDVGWFDWLVAAQMLVCMSVTAE